MGNSLCLLRRRVGYEIIVNILSDCFIMKNIIVICCALLCFESSLNASVKMTNGKVNVDEFLKSVMNSEKFDEIAEKIADKAVEKFRKIKNLVMAPVSNANFDDGAAYRVSEVDTKEPNNSEPYNKAEMASTKRHSFGKIDAESFMKKSLASLKDISLKFKHFKKSIYRPKKVDVEELMEEETASSKETVSKEKSVTIKHKSLKQRVWSKKDKKHEFDENENRIQTKAAKYRVNQLNKSEDERIFKPTKPKNSNESSGVKDSQIDTRDKTMPASEQKEDFSDENSKREETLTKATKKEESNYDDNADSSNSDSLTKEDVKNIQENTDNEHKKRQPGYEYLKLPEPKKVFIKLRESNVNLKPTMMKVNDKPVPEQKPVEKELKSPSNSPKEFLIPVRAEGNKLYTLERSPDYEDYHNEIARIQNQVKNNVTSI